MARRRSPLPATASSSSSSTDFEEGIPLMVATGRHGHASSGPPAPLSASLRRGLLRCHSRIQVHLRSSSSSSNRLKLTLLYFGLAAALVALAPLGFINLGANASGKGGLRAHVNGTASEEAEDAHNEFLHALYDIPLPTTSEDLDELNEVLEGVDPRLILKWAHRRLVEHAPLLHPNGNDVHPLVQVTSFGPTGLVVLHLLSELKMLRDVPVITMDTLHLFPESVSFYDTIQSRYPPGEMELVITKPLRIEHPPEMTGDGVIVGIIESRKEFEATYGAMLWKMDPQQFTKLTKIDPLNKALDEFHAQMWITGRRRSSGGERSTMAVLEFEYFDNNNGNDGTASDEEPFDASRGRYKLNPLAYWTYERVWDYIRRHRLPYNVLYDKGYTSLGDEMTTGLPKSNATASGGAVDAFERSGRFVGLGHNRTECGLHSHRQKVNEMKQRASEAGEELSAPTLACDKCRDLTVDNFEEKIATGDLAQEMLIEFYSPYCGGCQEFAPTLNRLANHLSQKMRDVEVARFDITEHEIPPVKGESVFEVESTPTLYRVRYSPEFHVERYEGEHDFDSILSWLREPS